MAEEPRFVCAPAQYDYSQYVSPSYTTGHVVANVVAGVILVGCLLFVVPAVFVVALLASGWPYIVIGGLFGLVIGVGLRMGAWVGTCPHCGGKAVYRPDRKATGGFDCPVCKRRIILRGDQFCRLAD